ncbi:Ketosteroid isomerase-related protein [Burkholderia sp. OK233]|nr:Ketosteroid isomerase-related protein [Burkholderia sp. OK233]
MDALNECRTMTKDQRKQIALEYMKGIDRPSEIMHLFADDAEVCFPKWGIASGREQILRLWSDIGTIIGSLKHDYAHFNFYSEGDVLVVEGTSFGETKDGVRFRAGMNHAGQFTDVFEIRDFKIQRLYIYLDPDYWGANTAPYPWLARHEQWPKSGSWSQDGHGPLNESFAR